MLKAFFMSALALTIGACSVEEEDDEDFPFVEFHSFLVNGIQRASTPIFISTAPEGNDGFTATWDIRSLDGEGSRDYFVGLSIEAIDRSGGSFEPPFIEILEAQECSERIDGACGQGLNSASCVFHSTSDGIGIKCQPNFGGQEKVTEVGQFLSDNDGLPASYNIRIDACTKPTGFFRVCNNESVRVTLE